MSSSRCYESATNKIKSTSPGDSSNVNHFIGDIAASLITVKKNPQYLPKYCNTVTDHCDTIYVGTRVRFWDNPSDKSCGREGFVHWVCNKGIFMSFPNDNKCEFVQLSANDRWVVKQQEVLHGALRILVKPHTDDILLDEQHLTSKEIIMRSSKKFLNDVYFRFPTGTDRDSYDCLFFKKQCNCAVKKRPKRFTCADSNPNNPGRGYYACNNLLKTTDKSSYQSIDKCDFFVWESEFDHGYHENCECGMLCKKIEAPKDSGDYFLVCFDKGVGGCSMFLKVQY